MTPKQIYQHNQQQIEELQFIMAERTKPTFCLITFDSYLGTNYLKKQLQTALPQYQFIDLDTKPEELTSLAVFINKTLKKTTVGFSPTGAVTTILNVFGLEMSLNPQLIGQINIEREHLFRTFPCVIFLWLNEENSLRLRREAADFASWITYDFTFFTTETEREKVNLGEWKGLQALREKKEETLSESEIIERENKIIFLKKEYEKLQRQVKTSRIKKELFLTLKALAITNGILKQYDEALRYLKEAKKIDNKDYTLLAMIGEVFRNKGMFENAIKYYKQSLEINEKNNDITFENIIYCYFIQGNYQKTIDYSFQRLYFNSKAYESYLQIAYAYLLGFNNHQKALEYFIKYHQLVQDHVSYFSLALVYNRMKKFGNALTYAYNSFKLKPTIDSAAMISGCSIVQGNLEEAEIYIREIIKIKEDKDAFMNLGHIYFCRHNNNEALKYYQQSLALFENKADFFKTLQDDYQYLKQYNITEKEFEQLQKELQ